MVRTNRKRGFVVTGNGLVASVFFLLVGVFGFNFFSENQASTTLSIEANAKEFPITEPIILDIYVITRIPFNALDVEFQFPNDQVEVTTIYFDETVIDVWVDKPSFSNSDGTVKLIGGTTRKGGVVGKSPIASVVLKPLKVGTVGIDVIHSLVLAHDGEGGDLQEAVVDTNFIIRELEKPDQTTVVRNEERKEYRVVEYTPVKTDLNNDGETTLLDLSMFLSNYGKENVPAKDFNQDGKVNLRDMSIILSKIISE